MLKVVIDTNILIDGSKDDYNYGYRIVDEAIAGRIRAFANSATLRENRLLVERKIHDPEYASKLEKYFSVLNIASGQKKASAPISDSDDLKLLASASASNADYLISSDHHLLDLEVFENTQIVSPKAFWSRYQDETGSGWKDWINQFIKNK